MAWLVRFREGGPIVPGGPGGQNIINALRGSIYASVAARETTAQLWQRIRSELGLPPGTPTGLGFQQVNRIRSEAAGLRNTSAVIERGLSQLGATGIDQAVSSRMITTASYARPAAERNLMPMWNITFQMQMTDEQGNPDIGWFTITKRGTLPGSVGDLQDMVNFDAEMMAGRYGKAFASAGSIQILEI